MLLNVFEDVQIRIYSKVINNFKFIEDVYHEFQEWCESNKLPKPLYGISKND